MSFDLTRARSYFGLDKGIIYLNHASHAPLPLPARETYEKFFDSWQKTAHNHDSESFRIFEEVRAKLAGFVGAAPVRVGLSPHTTFGMNILASGFPWQKGDNIIISEREFPASVYPWLRLRKLGVEIRFAKSRDGITDENEIMSASDPKTRLVHVSWVQFNNGNRVDLGKLGEFCEKRKILFSVDGIQGLGVVPIDVPSFKIDLFTCGCQKWMLGPCGTGFYYLSEKAEGLIEPPYSGWLSVDWGAEFGDLLRYDLKFREGPAKFEIGTYAFQDWRALNSAIDILRSFRQDEIWEHIKSLTDRLISYVLSKPDLILVSPTDPARRSGIVSFRSPDSRALYDRLSDDGFVVSYREGCVRVSPHFYNGDDEIEKLIGAIERFSA